MTDENTRLGEMTSTLTVGVILFGLCIVTVSGYLLGNITDIYTMNTKGYCILSATIGILTIIAGLFAFRNGLAPHAIAMIVYGGINFGFACLEYMSYCPASLWFFDVLLAIVFAVTATMSWHESDKIFSILMITSMVYALGFVLEGFSPSVNWMPENFGTWICIFFGFAAFAITLIYALTCWFTVSEPIDKV